MTREVTPLEVQTIITPATAVGCSWCAETYIARRVNRTTANYCSTQCKREARNRARRKGPNPDVAEQRAQELIAELRAENAELRRKLVAGRTKEDPCSGGCRMRIQLIQELYSPTGQGYYGPDE